MIKSTGVVMDMRNSKLGVVGVSINICKQDELVNVIFTNRYKEENEPNFKLGETIGRSGETEPQVKIIFDNVEVLQFLIDRLKLAKCELEKIKPSTKTIKLNDIVISNAFKNSKPQSSKIIECTTTYNKTKKLDRDIVLDKNGVLVDGYIAYLVAKMFELDEVKVIQNK